MRTAVIVLCVAACACSVRPPADRPLSTTPLPLSVGAVALAPRITVVGQSATVSWIENETRTSVLKFAERTETGWSEPRTVSSGDDWFVNYADVPAVARLDDGTLVAEWLEITDEDTDGYDMKLSFSTDRGATWSAPVSPHHDGTKTQHGFAALFQSPGAGLGVLWLDGRAVTPTSDSMTLRSATFDRTGRQLTETLVDDRVCDCCPVSVALAGSVPIVAYRDRSAGDIRDIAVSRFVNGTWTRPLPVHDDGWQITACPVNGPAIAAAGQTVVVAWMTAKDDQGRAFAAFSRDGGATFGTPVRVDDAASTGRVGAVLTEDGAAIVSWIEYVDGKSQLRIRRVDASGRRGPALTVAGIGSERTAGYPRMARRANEVLLTWTETKDGGSTVRTAAVPLQ